MVLTTHSQECMHVFDSNRFVVRTRCMHARIMRSSYLTQVCTHRCRDTVRRMHATESALKSCVAPPSTIRSQYCGPKHLASIKWIYPEGCYSQPPSLTRRDHFIKIACPKTAVRSSLQGRDDSTLMKDAVRITKACGSYIAVVSSAAAVAVRSSLQK